MANMEGLEKFGKMCIRMEQRIKRKEGGKISRDDGLLKFVLVRNDCRRIPFLTG